ncbi:glycosyltransferase [Paraglaciecola sp. 20A4]|uniref:glycosyltransferase family 2 protein n=1 Tax=Paraglaciecola sp. 20A4 TaxID=2687288 RepID=UPI0023F65743|nr:glycosyltransferase [Paraglaciecola sp. 20A4]
MQSTVKQNDISSPLKDMKIPEPNEPLISVIIPAYNAQRYIESTLESVFNQTYSNIEIIVVDDGSIDDTPAILATYAERLQTIKTKNKGVSHARNTGIEASNGSWIAFIDSDDVWGPTKLNEQYSSLGDCKWSHCDSVYIGENQTGVVKRSDYSHIPKHDVFEELIVENFITTSSVLIHKTLLDKFGRFDESLQCLEDWKLWVEIAQENPLAYCDKALLKYRVYSGSTSRKARYVQPLHIELINNIFKALPNNKVYKKLKIRAKTKSYTICSYIAEEANDFSFAMKCAYQAWLLKPINIQASKRLLSCMVNYVRFPNKGDGTTD